MHQVFCYKNKNCDDYPYRPLLWSHLHMMNVEPSAKNANLIAS